MDNNSNKRNSGLIALIVIAIIIITVIIIAVVTSNRDKNPADDTSDSVNDPAVSDIDKIETDIADDITDMVNDVTDDLLDNKESTDRESKDTDLPESTADTKDTSDSATSDSMTADNNTEPNESSGITASVPTEFCLPVTGYISKDYSIDLPVFSLTMNDYRTHSGIDIRAEAGATVAAFADGTVTDRYTDPFMGVCLEITHSGEMVSKYMNLSEETAEGIEVGSTVTVGQAIATVGNTAAMEASDESHLHFEVVLNDVSVDPMEYIEAEIITDSAYEE